MADHRPLTTSYGSLSSVDVVYTANGELILDVTMGPDGNPYIATDNRILRLVP